MRGSLAKSAWVLVENLAQGFDQAQRLIVVALPNVAPEDEACGASVHRLTRLVQHRFVTGPCSTGDEHECAIR